MADSTPTTSPPVAVTPAEAEAAASAARRGGAAAAAGGAGAGAGAGGGAGAASTRDAKAEAAALKKLGNEAFTSKDYRGAIKIYTEAIGLDPSNHLLFGNRSASYYHLGEFETALKDAENASSLDAKWVKGYLRQGQALLALKRPLDALALYRKAFSMSPKEAGIVRMIKEAQGIVDITPVEDLPQWDKTFAAIHDSMMRLGTLATFWNMSTKPERLLILEAFLKTIGSAAGGVTISDFSADSMAELPMQNYEALSLVVPPLWTEFYGTLSSTDKVALFYTCWDLCTTDERDKIAADVRFFFRPTSDGDALVEAKEEGEDEGKAEA